MIRELIAPLRCPLCGNSVRVCGGCLPRELRAVARTVAGDAMASCWSLVRYDDARRVILAMKRRSHVGLAPVIAEAANEGLSEFGIGTVSWAPTSRQRIQQRGFDPAEIVARAVGRQLLVPVIPLLTRASGSAQHGRTRHERLGGPEFVVRRRSTVVQRARMEAGPVLLVDDVMTTGATMRSAAATLKSAGIASIVGFAVAVSD
jgi:competence protein ComFC